MMVCWNITSSQLSKQC